MQVLYVNFSFSVSSVANHWWQQNRLPWQPRDQLDAENNSQWIFFYWKIGKSEAGEGEKGKKRKGRKTSTYESITRHTHREGWYTLLLLFLHSSAHFFLLLLQLRSPSLSLWILLINLVLLLNFSHFHCCLLPISPSILLLVMRRTNRRTKEITLLLLLWLSPSKQFPFICSPSSPFASPFVYVNVFELTEVKVETTSIEKKRSKNEKLLFTSVKSRVNLRSYSSEHHFTFVQRTKLGAKKTH